MFHSFVNVVVKCIKIGTQPEFPILRSQGFELGGRVGRDPFDRVVFSVFTGNDRRQVREQKDPSLFFVFYEQSRSGAYLFREGMKKRPEQRTPHIRRGIVWQGSLARTRHLFPLRFYSGIFSVFSCVLPTGFEPGC